MSTTTGVRAIWITLGSLLAVLFAANGTLQIADALARDQETLVERFDASELEVIDIEVRSGDVTIVAADTTSVTVTAEIGRGLWGGDHRWEMEGDRLVIESDCPLLTNFGQCWARYTIEVPADTAVLAGSSHGNLTVEGIAGGVTATVSSGDIRLDQVGGDVDVRSDHGNIDGVGLTAATVEMETRSGDIRLDQVGGHVDLRSDHGNIDVVGLTAAAVEAAARSGDIRLTLTDEPRTVVATSSHGNIDVIVPDTAPPYRVELSADHGNVDGSIRTDPSSERSITAHASSGDVTVRYP